MTAARTALLALALSVAGCASAPPPSGADRPFNPTFDCVDAGSVDDPRCAIWLSRGLR